jgi:hypothetical protein
MKHQWSRVLLGLVFGIMAKKETIISIIVYCLSRVYFSSIMFYIGYMDDTKFDRYKS